MRRSPRCVICRLLADELPGVGAKPLLFADMDAWGYSFRLGNTRAWFEQDSADARAWLLRQGITNGAGAVTGAVRV